VPGPFTYELTSIEAQVLPLIAPEFATSRPNAGAVASVMPEMPDSVQPLSATR
jgi:hypothetical protein